jgi:hypothetical protein
MQSAHIAPGPVTVLRLTYIYPSGNRSELAALVMPGPFGDMREIKEANLRAGQHFFEASAMRYFGCRVAPRVDGGRIFITSEQDKSYIGRPHAWDGQRRYTVRVADDSGTIHAASDFRAFETLRQARAYVRRLLAGEEVSWS